MPWEKQNIIWILYARKMYVMGRSSLKLWHYIFACVCVYICGSCASILDFFLSECLFIGIDFQNEKRKKCRRNIEMNPISLPVLRKGTRVHLITLMISSLSDTLTQSFVIYYYYHTHAHTCKRETSSYIGNFTFKWFHELYMTAMKEKTKMERKELWMEEIVKS